MRAILILLCFILLSVTQTGCLLDSSARRWPYPKVARPLVVKLRQDPLECRYQEAVAFHKAGDPRCIDSYLSCLKLAGEFPISERRQSIARSSLINMLETSQVHGRYLPGIGIQLCQANYMVPVDAIGFDWEATDFHQLHTVGRYRNPRLPNRYGQPGVGLPIVVQRNANRLQSDYGDQLNFAATAIFAPAKEAESDRILLLNPLSVNYSPAENSEVIAKDLTAPFAFMIRERDRIAALNFLYPQRAAARPHLFMAQPYEPGKIPVVLVHGLAADHTTWTELANFLNACPEFRQRFQLWYFQYPTGVPFLASAAAMRQQLEDLCLRIDPTFSDPALHQIKLVGHSMGGLISKLQATDCCDQIWNEVCRVSIEQLNAKESTKQRLRSWFRFAASNRVQQTVLIATPHRGSPVASRFVGKVSARLVNEPENLEQTLQELIAKNPGVFYNEFRKGYPTSIDLLDTGDQVLAGIQNLPYRSDLSIESIIGTGKRMPGYGPADGVVPVSSAIEPSANSEAYINATHTGILSEEELHHLVWQLIHN